MNHLIISNAIVKIDINIKKQKMKKAKFICAIGVFFLVGMTFTSCNSGSTESQETSQEATTNEADSETETAAKVEYKCPMNCEPDKQYFEPGECPVCHMELKKVESDS